jgi:putative flippase GtrA
MALNEDTSASPRERTTLYDRLRRTPLVRRILAIPAVQLVLLPARGNTSTHRFIRYSMVSAVAIVISQVTILICAWVFGLSGIAANTIGALTSTPASYELNRKWAWGKHGKSHLWREVVPFWALTLVGFLASTGMVELADNMAKSHGITGLLRALLIMGASLFAYGVVWIAKFMLFNRVIFADRPSDVVATTRSPSPAPVPNGSSAPPEPILEGSILEGQGTVGL